MPDHMPGSFFLDSPAPPKLDLAGAKSQIFQVPQTPSASSSLYRSISYSRKRPRHETEKDPLLESRSDFISTTPLANTNYRDDLAEDHQTWHGKHETSDEFDYRPNRYRDNSLPPEICESVEPLVPNEVSGIGRKRSRRETIFCTPYGSPENFPSQPPATASWGRKMINVVGKVLDFCWSGAFAGFYAGGGRGFRMDPGSSTQLDDTPVQASSIENDDVFTTDSHTYNQTPIPGQFPEDEIQRNWVVVPNDDRDVFVDAACQPTPTRRVNRKNISPFHAHRRQTAASRLGKRGYPPSTPTKTHPLTPRSPQSPSSAETKRHVAQLRRRERQEDASLQRLNSQLETMIKEGKAALGTRVEVDELDMEDYN
ncbi:hypothetical protein PHISCL_00598 [Aspergillus sclerotialis]|uniref:Uncharacterized protein n=1 Tax=Aspergillus sclerotialis TaxID=2070753 RepID=A0A3A2ZXG7_9EURO|nr:hypothetical protein PHISCL_00598 [Aspergillus sclerotialis]